MDEVKPTVNPVFSVELPGAGAAENEKPVEAGVASVGLPGAGAAENEKPVEAGTESVGGTPNENPPVEAFS